MSDQEEAQYLQKFQYAEEDGCFESGAISRLALLRLDTTTAALVPGNDHHNTTMNGSMKRQSPSSSSSIQEPTSKRITRQAPSSSAAAATSNTRHRRRCHHPHHFHSHTKLPLPTINSPNASSKSSIDSEAINLGVPKPPFLESSTTSGLFLTPQSPPETIKINVPAKANVESTFLPPATTLRRSVSDPSSSVYQTTTLPATTLYRSLSDPSPSAACQVATTTPPRPPAPRTFLRSPSSGETGVDSVKGKSPNSKRLKRMKDRMREMSQWWDKIICEGEEEDGGSEDNSDNTNTQKVSHSSDFLLVQLHYIHLSV